MHTFIVVLSVFILNLSFSKSSEPSFYVSDTGKLFAFCEDDVLELPNAESGTKGSVVGSLTLEKNSTYSITLADDVQAHGVVTGSDKLVVTKAKSGDLTFAKDGKIFARAFPLDLDNAEHVPGVYAALEKELKERKLASPKK